MTTTISASPQTLADPAPQLTHHDPIYTHRGLFNRVALPNPASLPPSLAKRRTKADRCMLSELGRTRNISIRHSSHKAMRKRIFFLLSGRHHMQKLLSLSYERVLQLDKRASLVSQYRLPSFRDGFSPWIQDSGHMDSLQSEITADDVSSGREKAGSRLPTILTLLEREWY